MNGTGNMDENSAKSVPVQFELVSWRGEIFGPYATMDEAARVAREKWPEQEQDEAREGRGWDIQVAVRS